MKSKEKAGLFLFVVCATIVTLALDVLIVKRYGIAEYAILNLFEWLMFASGYIAGNYFTKRSGR